MELLYAGLRVRRTSGAQRRPECHSGLFAGLPVRRTSADLSEQSACGSRMMELLYAGLTIRRTLLAHNVGRSGTPAYPPDYQSGGHCTED